MEALLLNEYQQLHLRLSESLDGHTGTALAISDHPINGIVPALQVPVHPVVQMVQDGWAHGEVPVMMKDVMANAHLVVKTVSHDQPAWGVAMKSFIEMIKVTVETLKPVKGGGLNITNNLMLDTLRDVRVT